MIGKSEVSELKTVEKTFLVFQSKHSLHAPLSQFALPLVAKGEVVMVTTSLVIVYVYAPKQLLKYFWKGKNKKQVNRENLVLGQRKGQNATEHSCYNTLLFQ